MKHIKIVGLCLAAMFLMSAVATATASASEETAEFQFAGGNRGFSSVGGAINFETTRGETLECKSETESGRTEGINRIRDILMSFKKCTITILTETFKCKSTVGPVNEEEIKTNDLEAVMKYIEKVREIKIGYLYKTEGAALWAEVECTRTGKTPIKAMIKGSIIGLITPINVLIGPLEAQKFFTLHFSKEGTGKPKDPKFELEAASQLLIETTINKTPVESAMEGVIEVYPLTSEKIVT